MLIPRYRGFRIEPTLKAMRELLYHDSDLNDVVEVLESGYECSPSRRPENILERCLRKGNTEIRAVVAKVEIKYSDGCVEEIWRLIHFGVAKRR